MNSSALIHKIYAKPSSIAPLIILVHGRSGTQEVMQTFKNILPEGCTIVSVQAPLPDPEGGFRWWDFKSATESSQESQANASNAGEHFVSWLEDFLVNEQLEPCTLTGIGFSQGAALLSYVVQSRPSLFKAIAMLASFVIQKPEFALRENISGATKIFMAHGSKDEIVPISIASSGCEFLKKQGFQTSFVIDQTGHKIGVNGMKALKIWAKEILGDELSSVD